MKANREEHCTLKKLNSKGKCVAYCGYNVERNYKSDCIGNQGNQDLTAGHETIVPGRRVEDYGTEETDTTITDRKNTSYDGWKLEDFSKLRQGSKSP